MHRRCCWPPDSASAESCSRSLTSSQSAADLQALLDPAVQLGRGSRQAVDAQAVRDVLEDRFRKRVRLLEHHADPPPQRRRRRRPARRCRWPSMRTAPSTRVPGMMSFIRFSVRRNVLLPQPDGPMNAVTWFGGIAIVMSSRPVGAVVEIQRRTSIDRRSAPARRLARWSARTAGRERLHERSCHCRPSVPGGRFRPVSPV